MGGKGYKPRKDYAGRTVSGDWEDSDRGAGNKATRRAGGKVKKKSPTYQAYVLNKEHHQKDADGKVIEHGDGSPSSLDELNRYGKETGKATGSLNKRAGTPVKKGGGSDRALNFVRNKIRQETGKPEGQQKKQKGKKPPVAGEYGARRSPAQIIAKRRASKASADAAMRDTRGT